MRKRHIIFIILSLIMAVALIASAQASVTTEKSGPAVGAHKAKHYILNCGTNVVTDADTGKRVTKDGLRGLPLLYPGDTVEFRASNGNMGYEFYDQDGNTTVADRPGKDGKVHVHVVKKASFPWEDGAGNPLGNYPYITKVKITGKDLVQLFDGTFHTAFGPQHESKGLKELKFAYVPKWCTVNGEAWLEAGNEKHKMTSAELKRAGYYTDEKSSTRAWAEDAMKNGYSDTQKKVLLTLRRPYIEGRYFTGVKFDSPSGKNKLSTVYGILAGDGWHGNYWEGWKDNQVEIHPVLTYAKSPYEMFSNSGSYDEELLVRFCYTYGRTVTFDACGGTIDGYPRRIYEAEGRQFFNQKLQQGKVDKAFAAGKAYVPVRSGYYFEGWYEDSAYKKPVTSIKDSVNKYPEGTGGGTDPKRYCRLYAKWTPIVSLKDVTVDQIEDQVCTGKEIKPALTLKYSGKTLKKGTDYSVAFKDNKDVGKATVTVTGKGKYTGSVTVNFKIVPKPVKLVSLTPGKTKLTVKWKKGSGISGYEIEYSLKKDFSASKTATAGKSLTETVLRNLKEGRVYYVRIRTYKTVNGKKYYSEWSATLKQTLKGTASNEDDEEEIPDVNSPHN